MPHKTTQVRPYYGSERREMIRFLPNQYLRVLEIGCAEGKFRELVHDNVEYWGIELNPSVANIASGVLDKVLVGDYFDVSKDLPADYFDLVICNDVIEHMNDEIAFFNSISTKMTTSGSLVASLPNVRYAKNLFELLVLKDWRYRDAGILDRTHLRFFTKKSILRSVQDCAFDIELMEGVNKIYNLDQPRGNKSRLKRFMQILTAKALHMVFGKDSLYLQFGFRAKVKKA